MAISRGWPVITADGKRVGDVTEVHGHYLLVSQGILFVRDRYLPLGSVDRVENERVILTVTDAVLRKMDLSNVPSPPVLEPTTQAMSDPMAAGAIDPGYTSDPYAVDAGNYTSGYQDDAVTDYMETPSYTRAQPNGLVEIEHGLNLAYAEFGYGQTMVLVPGWPFDSAVWEPLPTILGEDYRVVTYDHRGTGKSDAPWDYYSVDAMAGDLHRLLVEQALFDVTLVAWSSGTTVALAYANSYPKRVTRLVLLAPVIPQWLGDPESGGWLGEAPALDAPTQERWAAEILEDRPAFLRQVVDQLAGPGLSEPRRQWLWQRLLLGGHHAHVKTWEALRTYDPSDFLEGIQAPVTILSAADDRLSPPALGARLAELLPHADHRIQEDGSHALFLDQREAVIALLRELLTIPEEPEWTPEEGTELAEDGSAESIPDEGPETPGSLNHGDTDADGGHGMAERPDSEDSPFSVSP
ncbi:MAG TPA: alpha/beta fold hydrolase [Chloroflexota bacterium]|jgi:pimeloyl-ACP methyl ester carboxylesterase